jgi:hypothetical protein
MTSTMCSMPEFCGLGNDLTRGAAAAPNVALAGSAAVAAASFKK